MLALKRLPNSVHCPLAPLRRPLVCFGGNLGGSVDRVGSDQFDRDTRGQLRRLGRGQTVQNRLLPVVQVIAGITERFADRGTKARVDQIKVRTDIAEEGENLAFPQQMR